MLNKINISIDDISPHPKSSIRVLDRCFELIEVFPSIKFTLFIPMAYTRIGEKTYFVSEYPDFCRYLRNLSKDNFEFGWHGYYHGIKGQSSNDEFKDLNYNQAINVLTKMMEEAEKSGIKDIFCPILRPSAFRMSSDSFTACQDMGINILALSPKNHIRKQYCGQDLNFDGKIVYYNINPPFDPLTLYNNMEIVYHACEWDKSYLDKNKTDDLKKFLNEHDKVKYCFIRDLT